MHDFPSLNENETPFDLDFSSSENFYSSLLQQVYEAACERRGMRLSRIDDKRQREIIIMHAHGLTLDEIGKKFGITRERIRQIERKAWGQIGQFRRRLRKLEMIFVSVLKRNGGFDRIDNLTKSVQAEIGWTEREVRYLLNRYLGDRLSERFVFVGKDEAHISLTDYLCWKCSSFQKFVKDMVFALEARNESLTVEEFAKEVRKRMETFPRCRKCRSKMEEGSPELFLWIFKNDPELRASQERMTVRRESHFMGLNRSVLLVLKIAKRPMTKAQILEQLKQMFPTRKFSVKQIQSTTSNSPQCYDKIFLWDRGGIHSETLYVHKDYIKTDLPILDKIEKILIEIGEEGSVPQVRLNRIFNKYSGECYRQGIPNVYALFSSLKVRGCPLFSFQRSPYIGFKGNRQKISNAKILENFVRECGRPITRQEMRDYGRTLGLQDEHISNTIVLTNLIATQYGYIYREDCPETTPEFEGLVERIKERLQKDPEGLQILVTELFFLEKDLCETLNIVDAKMLYSLLRRFADPCIFLKYPLIFFRKEGDYSPELSGCDDGFSADSVE